MMLCARLCVCDFDDFLLSKLQLFISITAHHENETDWEKKDLCQQKETHNHNITCERKEWERAKKKHISIWKIYIMSTMGNLMNQPCFSVYDGKINIQWEELMCLIFMLYRKCRWKRECKCVWHIHLEQYTINNITESQ